MLKESFLCKYVYTYGMLPLIGKRVIFGIHGKDCIQFFAWKVYIIICIGVVKKNGYFLYIQNIVLFLCNIHSTGKNVKHSYHECVSVHVPSSRLVHRSHLYLIHHMIDVRSLRDTKKHVCFMCRHEGSTNHDHIAKHKIST